MNPHRQHRRHDPDHRQRLAAMRRSGYSGPAYLRGRPAYDFAITSRP